MTVCNSVIIIIITINSDKVVFVKEIAVHNVWITYEGYAWWCQGSLDNLTKLTVFYQVIGVLLLDS